MNHLISTRFHERMNDAENSRKKILGARTGRIASIMRQGTREENNGR